MRNTKDNCGSHRIAKAKRTKQKTCFSKNRGFFGHFWILWCELLFNGFGTSVRIHMTTAELTLSTSFQEILKNAFSPCKEAISRLRGPAAKTATVLRALRRKARLFNVIFVSFFVLLLCFFR